MQKKKQSEIIEYLSKVTRSKLTSSPNGKLFEWQSLVNSLPEISTEKIFVNNGQIQIGCNEDSTSEQKKFIRKQLLKLSPWRKGPFLLHSILIDSEWRSNLKWNRFQNKISPLLGRKVLDIGCGNGYFCFRMAFEDPDVVIGIDPTQLFHMQFSAIHRFLSCSSLGKKYVEKIKHFPIGVEDIPRDLNFFDTIFSMGVLYHRKFPEKHIRNIRNLLRPGGELILESLIIEGNDKNILIPKNRYASMRNVWAIPSAGLIKDWLKKSGFRNIDLIDISTTTSTEQRSTDWMPYYSLEDFLDKANISLTIEGYPAPQRALFLATK